MPTLAYDPGAVATFNTIVGIVLSLIFAFAVTIHGVSSPNLLRFERMTAVAGTLAGAVWVMGFLGRQPDGVPHAFLAPLVMYLPLLWLIYQVTRLARAAKRATICSHCGEVRSFDSLQEPCHECGHRRTVLPKNVIFGRDHKGTGGDVRPWREDVRVTRRGITLASITSLCCTLGSYAIARFVELRLEDDWRGYLYPRLLWSAGVFGATLCVWVVREMYEYPDQPA